MKHALAFVLGLSLVLSPVAKAGPPDLRPSTREVVEFASLLSCGVLLLVGFGAILGYNASTYLNPPHWNPTVRLQDHLPQAENGLAGTAVVVSKRESYVLHEGKVYDQRGIHLANSSGTAKLLAFGPHLARVSLANELQIYWAEKKQWLTMSRSPVKDAVGTVNLLVALEEDGTMLWLRSESYDSVTFDNGQVKIDGKAPAFRPLHCEGEHLAVVIDPVRLEPHSVVIEATIGTMVLSPAGNVTLFQDKTIEEISPLLMENAPERRVPLPDDAF